MDKYVNGDNKPVKLRSLLGNDLDTTNITSTTNTPDISIIPTLNNVVGVNMPSTTNTSVKTIKDMSSLTSAPQVHYSYCAGCDGRCRLPVETFKVCGR